MSNENDQEWIEAESGLLWMEEQAARKRAAAQAKIDQRQAVYDVVHKGWTPETPGQLSRRSAIRTGLKVVGTLLAIGGAVGALIKTGVVDVNGPASPLDTPEASPSPTHKTVPPSPTPRRR